jgi:hypothetical protein
MQHSQPSKAFFKKKYIEHTKNHFPLHTKKDGAVEEKMIENGRDLSCAVVLPAEDNL